MYLLEVRGSVACLPRCKLVRTEYSEDKSFYWTTKTTDTHTHRPEKQAKKHNRPETQLTDLKNRS